MRHVITADGGLNLRTGPGTNFPSKGVFKTGTAVNVLARDGGWAQVDVDGNGVADGFMIAEHLRPDAPAAPAPAAPSAPAAPPAGGALPRAPGAVNAAPGEQNVPATPL